MQDSLNLIHSTPRHLRLDCPNRAAVQLQIPMALPIISEEIEPLHYCSFLVFVHMWFWFCYETKCFLWRLQSEAQLGFLYSLELVLPPAWSLGKMILAHDVKTGETLFLLPSSMKTSFSKSQSNWWISENNSLHSIQETVVKVLISDKLIHIKHTQT